MTVTKDQDGLLLGAGAPLPRARPGDGSDNGQAKAAKDCAHSLAAGATSDVVPTNRSRRSARSRTAANVVAAASTSGSARSRGAVAAWIVSRTRTSSWARRSVNNR